MALFPDAWFKGINLRTNTGVMLVSSIKARRGDRRLRRALKRLKKRYTQDKIADIYKKYSSIKKLSAWSENRRRRKFEAALDNLVNNFVADYLTFRAYYLDCLGYIKQSLVSDAREGYEKFTEIEALFAQLEKESKELIFPLKEVEAFRTQIVQLFNDIAKVNIRESEVSDIRVERGGYPASVSIFSPKRWWRRAKIYRKEKKQVKLLGRDLGYYTELYNKVMQELNSGAIRQDLLFLLIEVFKRVDIADKRLEEIKEDLKLVLKKLGDEIEEVKKSLTTILTLLRNEPQIKDNPKFSKIEEDITKLKEFLANITKQDFKNTEALRTYLQMLIKEETDILTIMEQQAMKLAA